LNKPREGQKTGKLRLTSPWAMLNNRIPKKFAALPRTAVCTMKAEEEKVEGKEKGVKEESAPPGLILRSAECDESRPEEKAFYGFKRGILGFVDRDGRLYVTPGTRIKIEMLEEAGFVRRHPKIEVPYADGKARSKRWLRKNLPPQEIKRSVEENLMGKPEARVWVAMKRVNREGLRPVDEDFISQRCAVVREKNYNHIGLAASYGGILSFTDWEANTYLTPYSKSKQQMLESCGYVYVESMIKVPYAMGNPENREWLASNIRLEEWDRTGQEIREEKTRLAVEKARSKIEEMGLKELPPELLEASAPCEESHPKYIGMAGAHNGILSFTDPEGVTYVTPATKDKVELLRSLNYQFMGPAIQVPHSLKTPEDLTWLQNNIGREHWESARQANLEEKERLKKELAEKRKEQLGLDDLPAGFIERTIMLEEKQPKHPGKYYVRNRVLAFVDVEGVVYITPVLKSKVEVLEQANYKLSPEGFPVPYSDGTEADLDFIRINLSQEELDLTREEFDLAEEESRQQQIERIKKRLALEELPDKLLERSAITEFEDIQLIGRFCSRQGVTCFIFEDGYFYVTPTVPWKEKALRKAGYREPERLIRIPYATGTEEDRLWLEENLPSGELEKSRREIEELQRRQEEEKLKKLLEERGIGEEVPQELAARSAITSQVEMEQIGRYLVQGDYLGFVGPDAHVWITPNSPEKVKLLKEANYEYATSRIVLPHTSVSEEDLNWRRASLPTGEEERSRREIADVGKEKVEQKASELVEKRGIKDLSTEFLERFVCTKAVEIEMIGRYLEHSGMICLVAPDRYLYISPSTPSKLKTIQEAGYQFLERITKLPYCSGDKSELEWIRANLPEGELERCRQEMEEIEKSKVDEKVIANMEKFSLRRLPDSLIERSADSGHRDPDNIGRLGHFRGVLAFVQPDERTYVTWYSEEKEEILEECGYKLEGYMPIKVPYAMPEADQHKWLLDNLPSPDEEEEPSLEENAGG